MGRTEDLVEIANLAECLWTGYPETTARLRQHETNLRAFRDAGLQTEELTELRYCSATERTCQQWVDSLVKLAHLVAVNLPKVWEELQIVGRYANWHSDRRFDWVAAERELRRIDSAARSQINASQEHDCPVSLQQAAGIVSKSKRQLERWIKDDSMFPLPEVQGAGGKTSLWKWSVMRPYLEKKTGLTLPEFFPADRFRPGYGAVDD